jgi:tetrahydromethanopterin S-methyltransferase subunit G
VVADLAVRYKKVFADYMDYRGIEKRMEDIEKRLESQNQNESPN